MPYTERALPTTIQTRPEHPHVHAEPSPPQLPPATSPVEDKRPFKSIAGRLLRIIFACYFLVTFVVTVIQLALEYRDTEQRLHQEIRSMQLTFGPGITDAMWRFNTEVLSGIVTGITALPAVRGVKVVDEQGKVVRALGVVTDENGGLRLAGADGIIPQVVKPVSFFDQIFSEEFPLLYTDESGQQTRIGQWTVYSSQEIVVNQVRYGFILILVNSVIKSLALWFVFMFVVKRFLGEPLQQISVFVGNLRFDNLEGKLFVLRDRGRHDLHMVADKLNQMIAKLRLSFTENASLFAQLQKEQTALQQLNETLERRVLERTAELSIAKVQAEVQRQRADVANQAKSVFLSNMSHELRTPLNAVLGYSQILQREPNLSARQTLGLATIQRSGEHLLMMITDVLDLAKIEAGKFDLSLAPVQLRSFVRVVGDIIRVKAQERSLEFNCELDGDLPAMVMIDEKRLRQVLLNLLGNAVKFTEHGRVTLRVSGNLPDVTDATDASQTPSVAAPVAGQDELPQAVLRFVVSDTGIGMQASELGKIFKAFEQGGSSSHRAAGTGLGLAISRQLVNLMGGEIDVQSSPGVGSRFAFDIRVPVVAMHAYSASSVPPPVQVSGYLGPRKRVIVADDVVTNRLMLVQWLETLGFETTGVNNGQDAIVQCLAARPDLLITDANMPVLSGYEATARMRALLAIKNLPVIVVSAAATEESRNAARLAGANAFLTKPIVQSELLQELAKLLHLQWVDADQAPVSAGLSDHEPSSPNNTPQPDPIAGDSIRPPMENMLVLRELAQMGKLSRISEQARGLIALDRRYSGFAETLLTLAQAYESQGLLDLIQGEIDAQTRLSM